MDIDIDPPPISSFNSIRDGTRNQTTPSNRYQCFTPKEKIRVHELKNLVACLESLLLTNPSDAGFLAEARINALNELQILYNPKVTFDHINLFKVKNMETIVNAINYFGNKFESMVGFNPMEICTIANIFFDDKENKIKFENLKGKSLCKMNAIEVTLLLCLRLRFHYSSWSALSTLFNRDSGLLCKVWLISVDMIIKKYGWTIQMQYVERYKDRINTYKEGIQKWYDARSNNKWIELDKRIQNIRL